MKTLSEMKLSCKATCMVALSLCLGSIAMPVLAADVAGVQYQATTQAGNTRLLLNGAGVRHLPAGNLYTVGLYAEKKLATVQEVFDTTGATQLRLILLRAVSSKTLSEMLTQGLVANVSDQALAPLISELFDVGMLLSEQGAMAAGDSFQIDSHPLAGTTITIRKAGRTAPVTQTFANPGMFKAMMGIWLGTNPVDSGLKTALLGQSS